MGRREQMLTNMLINNLRDYAHQCWKDGEEEDYNKLHALANAIEQGNATDEEFDEAIYQCTL